MVEEDSSREEQEETCREDEEVRLFVDLSLGVEGLYEDAAWLEVVAAALFRKTLVETNVELCAAVEPSGVANNAGEQEERCSVEAEEISVAPSEAPSVVRVVVVEDGVVGDSSRCLGRPWTRN